MLESVFKEKLYDLGFLVKECDSKFIVGIEEEEKFIPIADVSRSNLFQFSTDNEQFNLLNESTKRFLFEYLCTFAKTPIKEREDIKYRVRLNNADCLADRAIYVSMNKQNKKHIVLTSELYDGEEWLCEISTRDIGKYIPVKFLNMCTLVSKEMFERGE